MQETSLLTRLPSANQRVAQWLPDRPTRVRSQRAWHAVLRALAFLPGRVVGLVNWKTGCDLVIFSFLQTTVVALYE